jgi:hypothetical protein
VIIDLSSINSRFGESRSEYANAKPFAHLALDSLFELETLRVIESEFPAATDMGGSFSGEIQGGKFAESEWEKFGPVTQEFVSACNSAPFLKALTALTGIEGLIPDP